MVDWDRLTDEQKRAAGTIDRNISLTAGAGTGKTTTLTARYLKLLQHGVEESSDGDLLTSENILTTTFTERAASELKESIREEVMDELDRHDDETAYEEWREIADQLEAGYIHTLHGFCARLLREHAVEAPQVDPGFETLDEDETSALIERIVSTALESHEGESSVEMLARRYDRRELRSILVGLLGERPETIDWANQWVDADIEEYIDHVWSDLHPISPEFARRTFHGEPADVFDLFEQLVDDPPEINTSDDVWGQIEAIVERLREDGIRQPGADVDDRSRQRCVNDICDILTNYHGQRYSDSYYYGKEDNWEGHQESRDAVGKAMDTLWEWLTPSELIVSADIETDRSSFKYLRALASLLLTIADEYREEKQRRNLVDYTDQIGHAHEFLQEDASTETLEDLRSRFAFVMVDEFQDTDPRQWEIIKTLTSDGQTTFDGDNIFVVGDAKQSIYRFRNADVTMFGEVARELETANESSLGEPTFLFEQEEISETTGSDADDQLSRNFRTLPNALEVMNGLFDEVFESDPEAPFEAQPQRLTPSRDDVKGIGSTVEYLCVPEDKSLIDEVYPGDAPIEPDQVNHSTELEAEALANRLTDYLADGKLVYETSSGDDSTDGDEGAVLNREQGSDEEEEEEEEEPETRPVKPEDIAILLRSRTHLNTYERALSAAGIPYTVASGVGFYETPEVEALANVLRTLADPHDERALYGALRSPVFGLTDDTVAALKARSEGEILWDSLLDADESELERVARRLEGWREAAGITTPGPAIDSWSELLTRIIDDTGYLVSISAGERSRQAVANVEKLRNQLRTWDEEGITSLAGIIDALDRRVEHARKEGDAAVPEDTEGVQILTVHDAKGEEFPVVAVPGLDRGFMDRGSIANGKLEFEEMPSGPAVGLKGPDSDDPMRDTGTIAREGIRRRRRREERAEEKRVLYVACTRARDHLLLSATHPISDDADPATEGVSSLSESNPENPSCWRDWVQDALFTSEVLEDLTEKKEASATIAGGSYTVRLPSEETAWEPAERESEATVTIKEVRQSHPIPEYRFSPSDLDGILGGEGEVVYDEVSGSIVYERPSDDTSGSRNSKTLPASTFGDIVHKICELRPPTERWQSIAESIVAADADSDISMLQMEQIAEHVERALEFVDEQDASEEHHELFVTAELDRGEIAGYIDLLLVTPDHFHVIDYKTGSVDEGVDAAAAHYKRQLDAYGVALHQNNPGRDVKTTLFFTETEEPWSRYYDSAELADLETSISEQLQSRLDKVDEGPSSL